MQVDDAPVQSSGDDDEDSLFGSPPPSPARGRSPQLALPTGPGFAENVGTIALPGSHTYSELPLHPAALLLSSQLYTESSSSTPSSSSHLSTIDPIPSVFTPPLSRRSSRPSSGSTSREHSRAPSTRRNQKGKEKVSTPRPPPPPIHLPNPDEPLPNNFLRNQQALLGLAGLVGGVNPATLSKRHQRGATSQNPIVIEDEFDPPPLGQGNGAFAVDHSRLPQPPGEEIITSLVKQRNIFPVLESLLRLLSGATSSSATPATGWARGYQYQGVYQSSTQNGPVEDPGPSSKRRRLNAVPAGAADWDVPYPFPTGEGPEQYRLRWEKERIKQLLAQLVGLVKGAARNAAARTYLQQIHLLPANPPDRAQAPFGQHDITDVTNMGRRPGTVGPMPVPQPPQETTPFDNLIASLFTNSTTAPPTSSSSSSSTPLPYSTPPAFGPHTAYEQPNSSEPPPFDTTSSDFQELVAILSNSTFSAADASQDQSHVPAAPAPEPSPSMPMEQPREHTVLDAMIDPELLAMSVLSSNTGGAAGAMSPTPALMHSPIASTSSLFDPLTPREEPHPEPEVYRPEQEDPAAAAAMLMNMFSTSSSQQVTPAPFIPTTMSTFYHPQQPPQYPFYPNVYTTPMNPVMGPSPAPGTTPTLETAAQLMTLLDSRRGMKAPKLNKQDVIRRAKERRRQLAAELERAKVELWETTIEQGVLAHLVKDSGNL